MIAFLQDLPQAPRTDTTWYWIAVLVAVLGYVLAGIFVTRVLARGGSPASTLLWVGLILAAPWVGLGFYYLMPRQLQLRRLRKRQNRLSWIEGELDRLRSEEMPEPPKGKGIERLLRRIDPDSVHSGNAVQWLPTGPGFLQAVERAVLGAQHFVHVVMYIFRSDESGRRLLEILTAAAARGVEVRLLYDSFGSLGLKSRHLADLHQSGGKTRAYLPLLWKRRPFTLNLRNHRKLIVVDGRTAFLGGRNIGDEYIRDRLPSGRAWFDAMVGIDGPVVGRLHRVFVEDWYNAAEEDLAHSRYFPRIKAGGEDTAGVVLSGPDEGINGLWWAGFDLINGAKECIEISSPYLVPPPTMLFALKVAAARGVRVRIMTNGPAAEQFVLYHAQRSYYREFLEAGIELLETTADYNHAKFMLVDGQTLVISSANMDLRSAHWNFELGVVLPRTAIADDVSRTLGDLERCSRRIGPDDLPRGHHRRVFDGLCRLLSPLL